MRFCPIERLLVFSYIVRQLTIDLEVTVKESSSAVYSVAAFNELPHWLLNGTDNAVSRSLVYIRETIGRYEACGKCGKIEFIVWQPLVAHAEIVTIVWFEIGVAGISHQRVGLNDSRAAY